MFSGLKLNSTKCEVAGIGVLKVAQEAVCGKRGIKLNTETVRMLGIHGNWNRLNILWPQNYHSECVKAIEYEKFYPWRKKCYFETTTLSKNYFLSFDNNSSKPY